MPASQRKTTENNNGSIAKPDAKLKEKLCTLLCTNPATAGEYMKNKGVFRVFT
ncbi:MAG: hypothetical protein IJG18_07940 [Kiritimatiellae bacterium]|nr:hypothetical protein [Kiritimatiellia bacterium]